MKQFKSILIIAAGLVSAMAFRAEAASPHETITNNVDGAEIKIVYGRPYSKDPNGTEIRKIWGGLVPWGQPWRMGADQATTLTTSQPLVIGGTNVPAGTYTLYLIPQETDVSKLAISKTTGQWGIPVVVTNDLARVDVKKTAITNQVDQFTMAIDKSDLASGSLGGTTGVLKMTWEKTEFSVPFVIRIRSDSGLLTTPTAR